MDTKCYSQLGGHRCQLPHGHKGKHQDFGTDDEPVCIRWSDEGVKAIQKELQKVSAG
jgi:hypothetical protein